MLSHNEIEQTRNDINRMEYDEDFHLIINVAQSRYEITSLSVKYED